MKYKEIEKFLKALRQDLFERGNRDHVNDYLTEDLIGHYEGAVFNREDVKKRIDYMNSRYAYRTEHLLDFVVIDSTDIVVCRVKQNGFDKIFCKLYTHDFVIIYRMRGMRIAEFWLMSESEIDYFAKPQGYGVDQLPQEKLSSEEIEKRDFALILGNLYKSGKKSYAELTSREEECLFYFLKGLTAKEIAIKLDISHRTVEDYLAAARQKFGCANKLELRKKILVM